MKLIALAGLAMLVSAPAYAGLQCGSATEILAHLKSHYGEVPSFVGVTATGAPTTITVSPSGTWTMLMAVQDKLCFIGAGKAIGKDA